VRPVVALVVFLALAFAAAAIGGLSAAGGPGDWYHSLRRPSWNPPDWVFGPVWSVLYLSIGVAGWLVWREDGSARVDGALTLWAVQLVLNAAWTWLFFRLHRPGLAFIDIVALALAIAATIVLFGRVSQLAAVLLVPYLVWVCFAAALNGTIWHLNR
jgi:translocator protein